MMRLFKLFKQQNIRAWPQRIMLLCVLGWSPISMAQSAEILMVLSNDSAAYQTMHQFFSRTLRSYRNDISITVIQANEVARVGLDQPDGKSYQLIISVGTLAARVMAVEEFDSPVICALIPSRAYYKLVQDMPADKRNRFSGWFIDQPASRYLNLIRAALPGNKSIGLLLGKESIYQPKRLVAYARKYGLELNVRRTDNKLNLTQITHDLLNDVQILLTLPDPEVINPQTIQSLLMTTYMKRIPLVTYSRSYVRAGGLMSIYSTPEHIAQDLAEQLASLNFTEQWTLKDENYPVYYGIAINQAVAKSLGLYLIEDEIILQRIREMETAQ